MSALRWNSFSDARILLFGTGQYDSETGLGDVPAVLPTLEDLRGALIHHGHISPSVIRLVSDPQSLQEMGDAIAVAAREASGLLVLYYIGHGVLGNDGGLHLAARSTIGVGDRVNHTGLRYADVARLVRGSRATNRVVVLDCCFASRALNGLSALGEPDDGLADRAQVPGGFVLTSAGRGEAALAPPGSRHTAFTGRLLRLLSDGSPEGPADLSLHELARQLARALPEAGLPQPRSRADNQVGELIIAANPAFRPRRQTTMDIPNINTSPTLTTSPYRGLEAFDVTDAALFFGRDRMISELTRVLADTARVRMRPLVVLGSSGAGKSSILRAGLLPAVQRGDLDLPGSAQWPTAIFTPGTDPMGALAANIAAVSDLPANDLRAAITAGAEQFVSLLRASIYFADPARRLLIVIDQFEELFSDDNSVADRNSFAAALAAAAGTTFGPPLVLAVIGIRSDAYGNFERLPSLALLLADAPVLIGAMNTTELRQAIELPAQKASVEIEPELVDILLDDLGSFNEVQPMEIHAQASDDLGRYEAGRLPLLSHALKVTWQEAGGGSMTTLAYRRTGGIRRSLAQTADRMLGQLSDADQEIARKIFARLVTIGPGIDFARRRVRRTELIAGLPAEGAGRVLAAFAQDDVRLLSIDETSIQMTHEALAREWPTLRHWIERDRASLLVEQDLSEAAARWDDHGRRPEDLLSGTRLAGALAWLDSSEQTVTLSPLIAELVQTSRRKQSRRARFRRAVTLTLAALLAITLIAGGVAVQQRRIAEDQRELAVSRATMQRAESARMNDPRAAIVLGAAAHQLRPSAKTRQSLAETLLDSSYYAFLPTRLSSVISLDYSPDNNTIAVASGAGSVQLWDVSRPVKPVLKATLDGLPIPFKSVRFSPNGTTLAVAGLNEVSLWDIGDRSTPSQIYTFTTEPDFVNVLEFSPDGTLLVIGAADAVIWNVGDPRHPVMQAVISMPTKGVEALAFRLSGGILATGSAAGGGDNVALWDISEPMKPLALAKMTHLAAVSSLAFNPTGNGLAVGGNGGRLALWNVTDLRNPILRVNLPGHARRIVAVHFYLDQRLTATSLDGAIITYFLSQAEFSVSGRGHLVNGVVNLVTSTVSPDGRHVAYNSSSDVVVLLNRLSPRRPAATIMASAAERIVAMSAAAQSPYLVVARTTSLEVWNTQNQELSLFKNVPDNQKPRALAYRGDGSLIATGSDNGDVNLWNPKDLSLISSLSVGRSSVFDIDFSPDGQIMATADENGNVVLWSVSKPSTPLRLSEVPGSLARFDLAFSPDGTSLAIAGVEAPTIWDIRTPTIPIERATLTTTNTAATSIAFAPDGNTVAVGDVGGSIELWDVSADQEPSRRGILIAHSDYITGLAFHSNGKVLGASSADSTGSLWDVAEAWNTTRLQTLNGHNGTVTDLQFLQESDVLVTTSIDGNIRLWGTRDMLAIVADPFGTTCKLTEGISETEWLNYIPDLPFRRTC